MTSYRPICDIWILARPKVSYYGAYPNGFLHRARELLGVNIQDQVLHVCSGKVTEYPIRGFGPGDMTVDIDESLEPDFVMDVREEIPALPHGWPAILCDPPYTEDDAKNYATGAETFPDPNKLLKDCLQRVQPGGRVGMLHYFIPRPPKKIDDCTIRFVACVGVMVGFGNRIRAYTVFEKELIANGN